MAENHSTRLPRDSDNLSIRENLASMSSELRFVASTMQEMRSELHQVSSSVGNILIQMAGLPAIYASQQAMGEVVKRVDSLEETRAAELPKFQRLLDEHDRVLKTLSDLKTAQDRLSGGRQWLNYVALTLLAVVNLYLAGKGKLWP